MRAPSGFYGALRHRMLTMHKEAPPLPRPDARAALLTERRNLKMARSANAYVRGNTLKFYEGLAALQSHSVPEGPSIWICGDCHLGNLGPVANAQGQVELQIRDLDQTVVGNPAHDLIRLGLSLATAARGSDLPGLTMAKMLEQLVVGYEQAFDVEQDDVAASFKMPSTVQLVMKQALKRTWGQLARERIDGPKPQIPLGKRFWPLAQEERQAIEQLFEKQVVSRLATSIRGHDDNAPVEVLDAAYWVKGCSSLGHLRYAVLLDIGKGSSKGRDVCLMDLKEAVQAAAPRTKGARMPRDNSERVVEGARHLAPFLGERMRAERFLDRSVFLRELRPQDLKIEIDRLNEQEAMNTARFLARVVGRAHARQLDLAARAAWQAELQRNRSKSLDAPSWLWSSIAELMIEHERGYLEHCRRYALNKINR
jgi:uncharacterized protein (DUF2252 family)